MAVASNQYFFNIFVAQRDDDLVVVIYLHVPIKTIFVMPDLIWHPYKLIGYWIPALPYRM